MRNLKIAAIDIGSNAIRIQVTHVIHYEDTITYKKLEYVRFPLRLGQDVFKAESKPEIGPNRSEKFLKLMHAFQILIELYEVDDYMACATSAMRESVNGEELVAQAKEKFGLNIEIISGQQEAELLNKALIGVIDTKPYLHIDVGGGSTELNLYMNHKKLASESFPIGSVRGLSHPTSLNKVRKEMRAWIKENIIGLNAGKITAIGTGGNIGKIFELAGKKPGKTLAISKMKKIKKFVEGHSLEERINKLQLNPDRADVIVPASDIYISVMECAKATKILVPDIGLKDGIMHLLYERNSKRLVEAE